MTDYTPKKPHRDGGVNGETSDVTVNLSGVPDADARRKATATLSLLSEGAHHCDECKAEITGPAVYFTRPRPDRRSGWEIVAITCPKCGGYEGEVA